MASNKSDGIQIEEAVGGGACARLYTDTGYVVYIYAPAENYDTGLFVLDEYLDELGYDNETVRKYGSRHDND